MTPIGHLTSSAVLAGSAGLLKPREIKWATAWYALFLIVFMILKAMDASGMWGMHLYDSFSDVPFYLLLIVWFRNERRKQLTLCIFLGGLVLSAYSHLFDKLFLDLFPNLPEGMWRPHNMFHTPMFGIVLSALFTPLLAWLMKLPNKKAIFAFLVVGYMLHITMDTITYNYPIYWLWPFSDYHQTFWMAFQAPDVHSTWLGMPFFVASPPVKENPQGYILYWSEPLLNVLLLAFYWFITGARKLAARSVDEPGPPNLIKMLRRDPPATEPAEPA